MAGNLLEALAFGGPGVEDATAVATNEVALPNLIVDEGGTGPADPNPRFVHVSYEGAAATGVIVKPGKAGDAMVDGDGFYIGEGSPGLILNVVGHTHLIHRGNAVATVHVVPLANQ